MSEPLLNVKNLSVDVEEKSILHGISLTINKGETHVLMGPNGAGKSTLGCTLMGNPNYHVTDGEIFFGGENITKEAADKRARLGMFLSFQNPLEVPGISLSNFIRSGIIRLNDDPRHRRNRQHGNAGNRTHHGRSVRGGLHHRGRLDRLRQHRCFG